MNEGFLLLFGLRALRRGPATGFEESNLGHDGRRPQSDGLMRIWFPR